MLQKIDNGSDGNCMYYAYAISLMYYLRARNDRAVTERVFDRLNLNGAEKMQLNAILAKNPQGRIAQADQDALEYIVGNAARALGAERTRQEYKTNHREAGFFISAQYGIEHYFKQELAQVVPEKTQQINNNFDNPALTDADIYRVQGIREAMQAFVAAHWPEVAVQLDSEPWDEVMGQWTKKFFDDNDAQYLNAYINRLETDAVWGTEETLYLIHQAIQGQQKVLENGYWTINYDTAITLHTYVNGQNPYIPLDQPDMILDNLNLGHWVSQIPENIFNAQAMQVSGTSSPQKQKCLSPKDSQILYLEKEQAVHQLQIEGLSKKLDQLAKERAEREAQCQKDEQLARELQAQEGTGFDQLAEQKRANIAADEQLARELQAQEQAAVTVQQQTELAAKARQEADARAHAEEQARIEADRMAQESIKAHEELERVQQQMQEDFELAQRLQAEEGQSVTSPQQQPALTAQAETRVEAADLAMAAADAKANAEVEARAKAEADALVKAEAEARARAEADAQAKVEQQARERAQAAAQAVAAAEARAQALAAEKAKVAAQITADHQLAMELHAQEEEQRKKLEQEVEKRKKADAYLEQIKKAPGVSAPVTKPAPSQMRKERETEAQIKKDHELARKLEQRFNARRKQIRLPAEDPQQQNSQSTGFSTGDRGAPVQLPRKETAVSVQAPEIKEVTQPQTEDVVTQSPAELTSTVVDQNVAVRPQVNVEDKKLAEDLGTFQQKIKKVLARAENQAPVSVPPEVPRQVPQDKVSLAKPVIQPSQELVAAQQQFNAQLNLLLKKRDKFLERAFRNDKDAQKFKDAYKVSHKLYVELDTASRAYFAAPATKDDYMKFKATCDQSIKDARRSGVLQQHRGLLKELLGNLALAVLGLGVLYGIAVGINYVNNKSLFFKFNTDSENVVNGLEQSLDGLKPKA